MNYTPCYLYVATHNVIQSVLGNSDVDSQKIKQVQKLNFSFAFTIDPIKVFFKTLLKAKEFRLLNSEVE